MSLLSGMNDILLNEVAMEAADDMVLFDEEITMEADELIDIMVDGDDIAEMEEEDEFEDEIIEEIDEEDNSIASASEGALTDLEFLKSLNLDNNDPITTHAGSIGQQSGTATFSGNYSNSFFDNNDPIKTEYGSLGQRNSSANPSNNFGGAGRNTTDRITTRPGSIGQQNSVAKDPTMESIMFFADLAGSSAMEGKLKTAMINATNRHNEKKMSKIDNKCSFVGVQSLNREKLGNLLESENFDGALNMVKGYGRMLDQAKNKLSESDPDFKKKTRTINSLIKTNSSLMVKIEKEKKVVNKRSQGKSKDQATQEAFMELYTSLDSIIDPVEEAYIADCVDMVLAFEQETNPDFNYAGSVGQRDSTANSKDNYSDGLLNEDPFDTSAGSEGQDDSYASFEENYGGGRLNDDPIKTRNGSIGQNTSTARDPVIESSIDDELDILNESLIDDFDDFDI